MATQPSLRTSKGSKPFRVLDLPPEIRNQIYKAYLGPWAIVESYNGFKRWKRGALRRWQILATCRQVNKEAKTLISDTFNGCLIVHDHARELRVHKEGMKTKFWENQERPTELQNMRDMADVASRITNLRILERGVCTWIPELPIIYSAFPNLERVQFERFDYLPLELDECGLPRKALEGEKDTASMKNAIGPIYVEGRKKVPKHYQDIRVVSIAHYTHLGYIRKRDYSCHGVMVSQNMY